MEHLNDPVALVGIVVALALGGVLKGATGAGAPVVAVPVIAAFFDTRIAVAIMVTPNLCTNTWQILRYRRDLVSDAFPWIFAASGAALAATGLMSWPIFGASVVALLAAMPLRARLARRMDRRTFDRLIMAFLSLLAVRLVWTAFH